MGVAYYLVAIDLLLVTIALCEIRLFCHPVIATSILCSEVRRKSFAYGLVTIVTSTPNSPLAWRNTFHVEVRSQSGDLATMPSKKTKSSSRHGRVVFTTSELQALLLNRFIYQCEVTLSY